MTAVNTKIGVQRENFSSWVEFRQADHTGIRQRHGPVAVTVQERPQIRMLLRQVESILDRPVPLEEWNSL